MKKIIVFIILTVFSSLMLFTIAEDGDTQNNIVRNIEISDYYGVTSLLVNLHLELGRWVVSEDGIFYTVDLLNQMKYYSDLDIIEYLRYAFDLQKSLDTVIFEISDILDDAMSVMVSLEGNLNLLEQKRLDCDASKEISDKNFGLALKDLDSKNMESNFKKSLEYEKCAGDARIYYNVQEKIWKQIEFYYEFLDQKYTYFHGNREEIINNYPEILYNLSRE